MALHPCVTFWSPGNVNASFHDVHAVDPVFVSVTFAVNPLPHEFAWYVTLQPPGGVVTVGRVRKATLVETVAASLEQVLAKPEALMDRRNVKFVDLALIGTARA